MHVLTANYLGNPNIGLFCYTTDKYCLVPINFPKKLGEKFSEVLKVPIYEMKAAGTSLLGVFFAGNDTLLVPNIMFESELKELEKFKIKYKIINSELTALGNNLLVGDECIANSEYPVAVQKDIAKALKIKVKPGKIAGLDIVGSMAALNDKGCLVSSDAQDFEVKFIKKSMNVKVTKGSVNFGSPFISSGLICNKNGFIIGDSSGGPEIQNADGALGFI